MSDARNPGRFTLLDLVRGAAAIWVFSFHMPLATTWQARLPALWQFIRHGDLGVPMFFVVSGFSMAAAGAATIRRGRVGTFLYRRAMRIYPPYWGSILVVTAVPFIIELISSAKTGHFEPPSSANLNYGYLSYSLRDWLLVGSLGQVFAHVPGAASLQYKFTTINAVYWTLAIEVQFYVVMAIAIALRTRYYAFLAAVTIVAVPFALYGWLHASGAFLPYWPMFAVGVWVFWILDQGFSWPRSFSPSTVILRRVVAGLALTGLVFWISHAATVNPLLFAVLFGTLILAAHGFDAALQKRLGSRGALGSVLRIGMALGAVSYSIYLLHGRLQFLSLQLARQLFREPSMTRDLLVLIITVCLCYPFYLLCERPFVGSRLRRQRLGEVGGGTARSEASR